MKIVLTLTLVLTFTFLAGMHFYWAAGGHWGLSGALPANEQGMKLLNPSTLDCIIVGVLLSLLALFYLLAIGIIESGLSDTIKLIGLWVVPIIFALRAIGDFKYVGFFKQIRTTEFALLDTIYFSPLCLAISLTGLILIRMNKVG